MDHLASGHQEELQQDPEGLFWEEPGQTTLISHGIHLTSPSSDSPFS